MENGNEVMSTETDKADLEAKKEQNSVNEWIAEITKAIEREKDYRRDGRESINIYEAEEGEEIPYNILYSNTETMSPALYNSVPRPVVKRRFQDDDPQAKLASELVQRTLSYELDTDLEGYETFDDLIQIAVLSALVPGRGLTRFKYDATFAKYESERGEDEPREAPETSEEERVEGELVCGESLAWDSVVFGYAKRWKEVPWMAIEHNMTKKELYDNFGDVGLRVQLSSGEEDISDKDSRLFGSRKRETKGVNLGKVYELWVKDSREVLFLSPGYDEGYLKRVDDPLKLSGFFPVPKPLQFMKRVDSISPVSLYKFYKQQATELNRITTRINKLITALKVRGLYDSTVEGIEKVLQAEDNMMIPAENVAALQQGQTLEKALFLIPIEKLIVVLQQLYAQRQQIKTVIYEITGIADIMRGSSVASETLGAQEIKTQWGTLRLKRGQKEVARYVRDCLRIMAEISVTKLSPITLKKMTGMPLPLKAEKKQAMALVQQIQLQQMSQLPAPGQIPPQQPQIPPELQKVLTSPTIEDLLSLLTDDIQRSYRIDIETNSTVDAEATEDKKDISELMNAIAQFLNGVAPAVEQGILPFEAAKAMLLGAVRRYRFGSDVEDMIKGMQPPQPKPQEPPDPTKSPEYLQMQSQSMLAEEQTKQETLKMNLEIARQEHQFKMEELAAKREELRLKGNISVAQHNAKMSQIQAQSMKSVGNTQ